MFTEVFAVHVAFTSIWSVMFLFMGNLKTEEYKEENVNITDL